MALGLSSAPLSVVTYRFEVRKHELADGLKLDDIKRLFEEVQSRLCQACPPAEPCNFRLDVKGKINTFRRERFHVPIFSDEDASAFLRGEPAARKKWLSSSKTAGPFPRTIYVINEFRSTSLSKGVAGAPIGGMANINGNWILLALRAGKRDDDWFAEEASILTHELGHNMGLLHSPSKDDIMHCSVWKDTAKLTPAECDAFAKKGANPKPKLKLKDEEPCDSEPPPARGAQGIRPLETFLANNHPTVPGIITNWPYGQRERALGLLSDSTCGKIPRVNVLAAPYSWERDRHMMRSSSRSSKAFCGPRVGCTTPIQRRQTNDLLTWRYPAGQQ
jgi:hypothetical protein